MDKPIKKYMKFVLCAIISSCGCTRNNQEDYTIGIPIENCSMVSYDNHNLTDNGVNIYCPSGSVVVAAMDGVVITLKKDSIDWSKYSTNEGNKEDPIVYVPGMVLKLGKYYIEEGIVYMCHKDSESIMKGNLKDYVDTYLTLINK